MCSMRQASKYNRSVKMERLSQRETKFKPILKLHLRVEKNLGEQSRKLANFVRHPKLLITKVSARKWPRVP